MKERNAGKICKLCGFYCINGKEGIGRWLDYWESVTYASDNIENCEARIGLTAKDPISEDAARILALIPGKLV